MRLFFLVLSMAIAGCATSEDIYDNALYEVKVNNLKGDNLIVTKKALDSYNKY
ncbi:hypothetical protein [Pseudoalteromonas sp. MMG012]|uniref:hypothetical protein n=1 Tax=Pseudoalteromonas sp. MMG012 TaxID=2822686 RepID=UPI001B3A24D0|nr:hypothetical protein [Pseudoalteromonas sp. MMG012]MBQ4851404.1 hypothetical protein [Pseudoalteromonas sp. MMG012]